MTEGPRMPKGAVKACRASVSNAVSTTVGEDSPPLGSVRPMRANWP